MRYKMKFLVAAVICFNSVKAQKALANGGDAASASGSIAYSIGQITYTNESSSNGSVSQGVQQPYEIFSVGTNEYLTTLTFRAFPIPANDYLSLEVANYSDETLQYVLHDLEGKQLQSKSIVSKNTQIDLSQFAQGIYLISIYDVNKEIKTYKIIKH